MKVIGITGSSGSGKSTVSKILANKLNADLIVADDVVKQLHEPNQKYFKEIVKVIGKNYLNEDGKINRKTLKDRQHRYNVK